MNTTLVERIRDYNVAQRKDGMVDASEFLKRHNSTASVKKRFDVFLRAAETKAFIDGLKAMGVDNVVELEKEKQGGHRPMKHTWWLNPALFVYFAMWLDTSDTIVFAVEIAKSFESVWDIYSRVADNFGISDDESRCEKIVAAMDYVVFGRHEPNMWVNASESQRSELRSLLLACESDSANGMGFDAYIDNMRTIYISKHKNDI